MRCMKQRGLFGFRQIKMHLGSDVGKAEGFQAFDELLDKVAIFIRLCDVLVVDQRLKDDLG